MGVVHFLGATNWNVGGDMLEILSLGAGVQSSTVLLMSHHGELPKLDAALFADTGWEPPAVYEHLSWLEQTVDIPIHRLSAGNIRDDHMANTLTPEEKARLIKSKAAKANGMRSTIPFFVDSGSGTEGRTFRSCTKEYKIEPQSEFIRRVYLQLRKGQRAPVGVVRNWFGISVDEAQRMTSRRERFVKENYYPLVEKRMDRSACLHWMHEKGYPEPPRSACIGCPFHSNAEWRRLKMNHPAEFEDACQFDDAMRTNGALSGEAYLHRSLVPLRDVDFRNDVDRGQLLLWQDECTGMCGV